MILPDEPPSAAKARLESSSTLPVARDVLEGDDALCDPLPAYAQAASSEALPLLPRHELTHSSKHRFLETLISAVFLLLPVVALILLLWHKAPHTPESRDPEGLGYCMDFHNMTFEPETGVYRGSSAFVITSQAPIITFQSLSPLAMGDFTVVSSHDQAEGVIAIAATAAHKDRAAIDSTHLCTVRSPGGESRSTISVSDNGLKWDSKIMLKVLLVLPLDMDDYDHTYFPELRTNMPFFQQRVDFEERPVHFKRLSLHSVNSSIEVAGVVVQDVDMSTTDADISAHLSVTNSASFKATNGSVWVNADIINTVSAENGVVTMTAERGSIVSKLNLKYPTDRDGGSSSGGFNVSASCSYLPLVLTVTGQPPESVLHLNATTEQSQANIYLPPAFEGELSAFSRSPIRLFEERVLDPRGEDREREVQWEVTKLDKLRQAQGRVHWKPSRVNGTGGDVFVRALDAPIAISV